MCIPNSDEIQLKVLKFLREEKYFNMYISIHMVNTSYKRPFIEKTCCKLPDKNSSNQRITWNGCSVDRILNSEFLFCYDAIYIRHICGYILDLRSTNKIECKIMAVVKSNYLLSLKLHKVITYKQV